MSQLRPARQILYAGGGIAAVLLLAGLFLRTLPPSRQEVEESAVTVRQASCYVLEADGKAAAYFADYADSVFTGGSVSRDSVHTRCVVQRGYWVNRLPVVPSCFGRIVTGWSNRPAAVVNLGNDAVRRLLFRTLVRMDAEMGGLQTQHNELGYYLRVHSVQDYGYNKIADYHEVVVQRMDSLRKVLEAVHGIVTSHARLRIRQLNSYSITAPGRRKRTVCNRLEILRERNAVLLQTENGMTPFRVTTSLRAGKAADELKRYYRQHPPRPSLPEPAGIREDGGRYDGETRKGRPDGYGRFYGDDGRFYDGHWKEGLRDGFGIYVAPHEYLQVGEWKKGVFKGERLTYNADRIYGIDLSRHQHEQQGRYYHINWNRLRITHLGTLSSKTVKGRVDYPVSFAYVKSTEGCTVLNAYYLLHDIARCGTGRPFPEVQPLRQGRPSAGTGRGAERCADCRDGRCRGDVPQHPCLADTCTAAHGPASYPVRQSDVRQPLPAAGTRPGRQLSRLDRPLRRIQTQHQTDLLAAEPRREGARHPRRRRHQRLQRLPQPVRGLPETPLLLNGGLHGGRRRLSRSAASPPQSGGSWKRLPAAGGWIKKN